MTLHRLHSSDGLLARKGGAAPLSLNKTAIEDLDRDLGTGETSARAPASEPVQLALVPGQETADPAGSALDSAAEPPPAASLLPFALHRTRRDPGDAWELVSPDLLARMAQVAGQVAERAEEPEPAGAPAATQPALESASATQDAPDVPASPGAAEARPKMPAADPAWRIGVDTLPQARRAGPALWLGQGVAACVLIGGIAWWSFAARAPEPDAAPQALETQSGEDAAPAPLETAAPAPVSEAPPAGIAPPEADPAAPSVELVRIETNGDAVIAGRAAPNSELILLDNGTPIGTVVADAFGEWVFIPDRPLPQGGHEFGLVLKSVQGKIKVPAVAEPSFAPPVPEPEPGEPSGAGVENGDGAEMRIEEDGLLAPAPPRKPFAGSQEGGLGVPVPGRKPDPGAVRPARSSAASPPGADFVVQLASVKTLDGARREWKKLQSRFPEVLSGMNLDLHETKLAGLGTVIRVRTGPFPGPSEAARFCALIRAGRRDCLVVRTSGGN